MSNEHITGDQPFTTLIEIADGYGELYVLRNLSNLAEFKSECTEAYCDHHRKFYSALSLELELLADRMQRLSDAIELQHE